MNGREVGSDVYGVAGGVPVLTTTGFLQRMTICPACQEIHGLADYCADCNALLEQYGQMEALLSMPPDNRVLGGLVPHFSLRSAVQRAYFWAIRRPFYQRLMLAQLLAIAVGGALELVVLHFMGLLGR